jgi:uncharacterized caspase-like protein
VTLKAIASDDEDLQGWTEIRLTRRLAAPILGDLYVLSVGVSQYRNSQFNLKYAARDADAFANLWKQTEGSLYRRVVVTRLVDAQATAANVRAALVRLAQTATDRDGVALFLSGHGVQQPTPKGESYYFAPHEVNPTQLSRTALPWTVFHETLRKARAKRVLLFLDACHSGNALGARQANNEQLLGELLKRQAGVLVFASSRRTEFSYEVKAKQHGAFTAALIEGIGEGRADLDIGSGRDGVITSEELQTYLRTRVPQLTGNLQTPICPLMGDFGEPFPLARAR